MSLFFENISFNYRNGFSEAKQIFSDFSLNIYDGEKVGVFGKIGSGKSTLIKFITGEEKLHKGKILFQNKDIKRMKNPFENISILFQKPEKQFVFPSIKDEINFISEGQRCAEVHSRIDELAKRFNLGLKLYLNRDIFSVSSGELRLIQIILVLSSNKPYLILDDPFLFLDEEQIKIFKKILSNYDNTILIFARNQMDFEELINRAVIL